MSALQLGNYLDSRSSVSNPDSQSAENITIVDILHHEATLRIDGHSPSPTGSLMILCETIRD